MAQKGSKTVLAFGTFDLIHPGHLFYLNEAKKLGNKLIVVVARDLTVQQIKGRKPAFNEEIRKKLVSSLKPVDKAILGFFDSKKLIFTVKKINPVVIAMGYDQKPSNSEMKKQLKEINWNGKLVRIKPFHVEKFKSSKIKETIQNGK